MKEENTNPISPQAAKGSLQKTHLFATRRFSASTVRILLPTQALPIAGEALGEDRIPPAAGGVNAFGAQRPADPFRSMRCGISHVVNPPVSAVVSEEMVIRIPGIHPDPAGIGFVSCHGAASLFSVQVAAPPGNQNRLPWEGQPERIPESALIRQGHAAHPLDHR
jgi:hypothetical protein